MKLLHLMSVLALAGLLLMLPAAASASLVYDGSLGGQTGSGLGAVATILTIHNNDVLESGSVSWNGSADVKSNTGVVAGGAPISAGVFQNGQTQTQTFATAGITAANQIAIVFNASQEGTDPITLTGLEMKIYRPDGTVFFTADLASAVNFPTTFPGVGKEGYVFDLDATQAGSLQTLLNPLSSGDVAALRVGLAASVGLNNDGPETFNLAQITEAPVPEPATLLLIGTGLFGIGARAWRRRQAR